jgi:hypothetical protein
LPDDRGRQNHDMVKQIAITDAMRTAFDAIAEAEQAHCSGTGEYFAVELAKFALADAVRIAIADRCARLPERAVSAIVQSTLRPKRGRRRA